MTEDTILPFQDQIPNNDCWGCGPHNEHGLHVKSTWEANEAVCIFQPSPWHRAGPPTILNGGIIATIIDCHCVCTAIAAMYNAEGGPIGSDPAIWCATASLQITYLRPTPIEGPVQLRARVTELSERKAILTCSLLSADEQRAHAEVVAVRVRPEWRHGAEGRSQ
jgi:acyl-coenzyme A thioesterase PaaI-like protein